MQRQKVVDRICGKAWLGGLVLGVAVSFCAACSSYVAVSGREDSTVVLTNAHTSVQYNGCFWKNDLWEEDWKAKKSRRNTLKIVRVKIYPWQSIMSVLTFGLWVPVDLDWELNGDKK